MKYKHALKIRNVFAELYVLGVAWLLRKQYFAVLIFQLHIYFTALVNKKLGSIFSQSFLVNGPGGYGNQ